MKRDLKKLLACAALAYGSVVSAETNTTGVTTGGAIPNFRPVDGFNSMGGSGQSSLAAECDERENCMGGCLFGCSGFDTTLSGYTRGTKRLGEKLGVDGKDSFQVKDLGEVGGTVTTETGAVNVNDFIYLKGLTVKPKATISLNPEFRRAHFTVGYKHNLGSFYEGLEIGIALRAAWAQAKLTPKYTDTKMVETSGNGVKSVEAFFQGSADDSHATLPQKALQYALFQESNSKIAVQDIPVWLGLRVVDGENFKAKVHAKVCIPVGGSDIDTKFAFEPKVAERNFKLGGGLCINACLVEGADYKASFDGAAEYLYAWARNGKRLPVGTRSSYDHYKLVVQAEDKSVPEPLINVLMRDHTELKVQPQHTFNASACLSVEKGCFVADLRYAFHYLSRENNVVKMKDNASTYYYLGSSTHRTYAAAATTSTTTDLTAVKTADFNWNLASLANHYLGLGIGCVFKDTQYPANLGVSLGYELAQNDNRNADYIVFGVKGCICF